MFIFIGVVNLETLSTETKEKKSKYFFEVLNIMIKKQIIKKNYEKQVRGK